MSMYNMLFGTNQFADVLLKMLGIQQEVFCRFRDCYPSEDGTKIIVYTRNGGGNRDHWEYTYGGQGGAECPCPGCFMQYRVHKLPGYVRDWDDDFDCTYASIEFSVPPEFMDDLKAIADSADTRNPSERFQQLIADMNAGKDNSATARAMEVGKQIFGAIEAGKSKTVATPEGSVTVETVNPPNPQPC